MARLTVPTTEKLPSTLRVESSNHLNTKSLNRLSRETLISLAINWLDEDNIHNAAPFLDNEESDDEDPDELYPPCRSIEELRQLYLDMHQQKGSKRDIISRILEGDWRHGLTLYQLAMVDFTHFDEHPTSQKWTAYSILPLELSTKDADQDVLPVDRKTLKIPRFHPSTFLQNLQKQALPDVKAHYQFYRPRDFPVLLLRIFVIESPYNSGSALSGLAGNGADSAFASSRTIYLAFPDGAPSIYITKFRATGPVVLNESRNLLTLIIKGVPNALSRPRERFTLKATNFTSKNLDALLDRKGAGRGSAAGGGWSIYADDKTKKSPLDTAPPTALLSKESTLSGVVRKRKTPLDKNQRAAKRARLIGKARFGTSAIVTDGKGVERVDILFEDPLPASNTPRDDNDEGASAPSKPVAGKKTDALIRQAAAEQDDVSSSPPDESSACRPSVKITLQGQHVFAGIRQLVEAGIIDGTRMPGWMTGEDGVTMGVVRNGRIKGNKVLGL